MADLAFVALTIVVFVVLALVIRAVERPAENVRKTLS